MSEIDWKKDFTPEAVTQYAKEVAMRYETRNAKISTEKELEVAFKDAVSAVLSGKNLVNQTLAIQLGAILVQLEHNNFNPQKHKPGFLEDLKWVLPSHYTKVKGIEANIYAVHTTLTDSKPKVLQSKYLKFCRQSLFWGSVAFVVKEKLPSKSKLVQRFLCFSPKTVVSVNYDTTEVLLELPMDTLRRWAAPFGTITLDFGDDVHGIHSFQTSQSEEISVLVAGLLTLCKKNKTSPTKTTKTSPTKTTKTSNSTTSTPSSSSTSSTSSTSPTKQLKSISSTPTKQRRWSNASVQDGASETSSISNSPSRSKSKSKSSVSSKSSTSNTATTATTTSFTPTTATTTSTTTPPSSPRRSSSSSKQKTFSPAKSLIDSQVLTNSVHNALAVITTTSASLATVATLPPPAADGQWRKTTRETCRTNIVNTCGVIAIAVVEIITLCSSVVDVEWRVEKRALAACLDVVATNLEKLSTDPKMFAALVDTMAMSQNVLVSTRSICSALNDITTAVVATVAGSSVAPSVLTASEQFGGAVSKLIEYVCTTTYNNNNNNNNNNNINNNTNSSNTDTNNTNNHSSNNNTPVVGDLLKVSVTTQESLISRVRAVLHAAESIVQPAKALAGLCTDAALQSSLILAAKSSVFGALQLVTVVQVLGATSHLPPCNETLRQTSARLRTTLNNLFVCATKSCTEQRLLVHLEGEVKLTTSELARFDAMLKHIMGGSLQDSQGVKCGKYTKMSTAVTSVAAAMCKVANDTAQLVSKATEIAKAASVLVGSLKRDATKEKDVVQQKRLNWAARSMTDVTSLLVKAAKVAAQKPSDPKLRDVLLRAGQALGGQAANVKDL